MSDSTKQLARGTAHALGLVGLARILRFVLQVILGRVLGAGDYGVFSLVMAVTYLTSSVSLLGLPQATVRLGAAYQAAGQRILMRRLARNSAILSLGIGAFFCLGVTLYAEQIIDVLGLGKSSVDLLLISIWSLPLINASMWVVGILRSQSRAAAASLLQELAPTLARFVLITGLLVASGGLFGAVWGHFMAVFIAMLLSIKLVRRQFRDIAAWKQKRRDWQPPDNTGFLALAKLSAPMMLSGFAYMMLLYVDRFMIAHYLQDTAAVGIYTAASTIAIQLAVALMAINTIFAPMVSKAFHKNAVESVGALLKRATWWSLLLAAPFSILLAINAPLVMSIFGDEFIGGSSILIILIAAQVYNVATGPVGVLMQMAGRQNMDLLINLILLLANIVLNVLLIPKFGLVGAAVATLVSMVAVHSARLILVRKVLGLHPLSTRALGVGLATFLVLGTALAGGEWSHGVRLLITLVSITVGSFFVIRFGLDAEDKTIVRLITARASAPFSK